MKALLLKSFVIAFAVGVLGTLAVSPRHADAATGASEGEEPTATPKNTTAGSGGTSREPNANPPATGNSGNTQQQQDSGCCGMGGSNSNG